MHNSLRIPPLFVDSIHWLTLPDQDYVLEASPEDYHALSPYLYAEKAYLGTPMDSEIRAYIRNGKRVTSGDMACKVLEPFQQDSCWDAIVLAQSYPDRYALNPPLARLLHEVPLHFGTYLGLSHLGPLAAVEFIPLMHWTMQRQALVVFSEQRILPWKEEDVGFSEQGLFLPRKEEDVGFSEQGLFLPRKEEDVDFSEQGLFLPRKEEGPYPRTDMAVAMEVRPAGGALELHYEGKHEWSHSNAETILASLIRKYSPDQIFIQSALHHVFDSDSAPAVHRRAEDAHSGDVWIQLAEWLSLNQPEPGTRVLLAAGDDHHQMSVCSVTVHSMPALNLLTFSEGEICHEESGLYDRKDQRTVAQDSSTYASSLSR
ncbi:hypothetical protein [Paenibacillus sp. MER 78]|uniref:hypothetical protein n=1 Tax=Paenibacillus sp. MER 78 TaxID=2939571 RepID=UPI00203F1B7F|nr:hypothetical protein [Paenibacillus sp. MER 78]